MAKLRIVKPEIRIVGIDDGQFTPRSKEWTLLIGAVFRGGKTLDGAMATAVQVDGVDATEKISDMVLESRHYGQLRVIMLYGITVAGFNVVNIKQLNRATKLPVIVVTDRRPNLDDVDAAIKRLDHYEERKSALAHAGEITPMKVADRMNAIYVQSAGISRDQVREILRMSITKGRIPEPIRVAHLIASAISEKRFLEFRDA